MGGMIATDTVEEGEQEVLSPNTDLILCHPTIYSLTKKFFSIFLQLRDPSVSVSPAYTEESSSWNSGFRHVTVW